jgi:OmpA-OmpF porin, OOP family
MSNILDALKGYITPELLGAAANQLGESESGVSKAIGGLLPTVLSGLVSKSTDANAFGSIFNQLSDSRNAGFLDNIGGLIGGGNLAQGDPKDIAGRLMGSLFGDKVGGILNLVSNFSGVKSSTTSSLLGMVGPLIMGYLGKRITGEGMNATGLASLLGGQKSSIMGALPAGMGSLLGFADMGNVGGKIGGNVPNVPETNVDGGFGKWLWPLLLLLGLGGLFYYFTKGGCSKPEVAMPKVEMPKVTMPNVDSLAMKAKEMAAAATSMFKKKICETELNVASTGIEAGLVTFVEDAAKMVDKTTWFNFDRLTFETGKASLDMMKSEDQLKNMAAILKCFPKVALKVGGYTDNVGNPAANMKLSQARAETVVAALVKMGVDAKRLAAEGYGDQHPVGDNATEEGKAANRRIAVRVTAK